MKYRLHTHAFISRSINISIVVRFLLFLLLNNALHTKMCCLFSCLSKQQSIVLYFCCVCVVPLLVYIHYLHNKHTATEHEREREEREKTLHCRVMIIAIQIKSRAQCAQDNGRQKHIESEKRNNKRQRGNE